MHLRMNSSLATTSPPKKVDATESYVLIGAAKNNNVDLYVVRSVVNHFDNKLNSVDVLYAINTKKELTANKSPRYTAKPLSVTSSDISIAELIDVVKENYPDILPESVLRHYGYDARPEGDLSSDVLYQQRDNTLSDREILELAADGVNVDNLTDGEKTALQIFKDHLTKLEDL